MNITCVLYNQMTALDLVGPYQVLSMVPGVNVRLAAVTAGPQQTDNGMRILADCALSELRDSELILVPGTGRPNVPLSDAQLIAWLREHGPRARWLTSVCTGSLLLGAAGLLRGKRATTHWLALAGLREFGAEPAEERVVVDGSLITAAGVSAGIDMALALVGRVWGRELAETIQLGIEYDPAPPFASGSPRTAAAGIVSAATEALTRHMSAQQL
ncbi:MAG TPA: DJ-1/PfpI family protein [Polyangiales bacterium]|nr:DJ-1/PfpI family protein [Polyangiales bacterium]